MSSGKVTAISRLCRNNSGTDCSERGSSNLARLSTSPPTGASRCARPARAGLPNATPSGRGRLLEGVDAVQFAGVD
jgi:hypothetical protein